MSRFDRMWQSPWTTRLLVAVAVLGFVRLVWMLPDSAAHNDFAHYYVSSRALLDGENPYAVSLADRYTAWGFEFDERIPHATNPPPLLWLFAPFAALSPLAACLAWQSVQLAALLAMLWLTWSLTRGRISPAGLALAAVVLLWSCPLYWHVYHGQVQLLLGAMLLAAFWLHRRRNHSGACALVACAGLLKLFPLVLLPWFLWTTGERRTRKLARAAAVGAAIALAVLLSGPQLWGDFVHGGMQIIASNAVNRTFNFSLPSLLGNLTYAWFDFAPPESAVQLSRRVGMLAGLALIGWGYAVCLRGRADRERQFSLLCLAMLAGGITMWGHYLVMLLFPAVVVALGIRRSDNRLFKAVVGAALLVIAMAGTGTPPLPAAWPVANVLVYYLPLWAVLVLIATLSRQLLTGRVTGESRYAREATAGGAVSASPVT